MTNLVKSPARLDITDLPRDPQRCLGTLRQTLVATTNYCRRYPKKLAILKAVLKYAYNYIVEYEKAEYERKKAAEKAAVEKQAQIEADALDVAKKAAIASEQAANGNLSAFAE